MNRLRLSIVTPTLNSVRYFEECLQSIHGSPPPEITIQHIVVDGGSEDGTLDLARRYPCLVIRDEDEGLYEAMNIGIRRADGDVIGILNSDDSLIPGALAAVAAWYGRRRAEWAAGGIRWIDADGAVRAKLPAPPGWMPLRMFASLGWNCLHHGATFIMRDFYSRIGEYDTSYPIAADYDNAGRSDVILTARGAGLARYLAYWSPAQVLDLQFRMPDEIRRALERAQYVSGRTFATVDIFDPPRYYEVLRPELADSLRRVTAAVRPEFDEVATDPIGPLLERRPGEHGTRMAP